VVKQKRKAKLQIRIYYDPVVDTVKLMKLQTHSRALAEKFSGEATEKRPKISKKYREIALFASSGGEGQKKRSKNSNKKAEK